MSDNRKAVRESAPACGAGYTGSGLSLGRGDEGTCVRPQGHTGEHRFGSAPASQDAPWTLVERYVARYPHDWRMVFKRGNRVLEVMVPEEVWRAFDAPEADDD